MRILTTLTALGDDPYRDSLDVKKLTDTSGCRLRETTRGPYGRP